MPLSLGKSLNRCYSMRIPFLDGFYDINTFFNKKSTFLLFGVDSVFIKNPNQKFASGIKILMFKNLKASKFCETFLNLNSYNGENLDIIDQYHSIKGHYSYFVDYKFNESVTLSKFIINEKNIFDCLILYGFTFLAYEKEFFFMIAERQNIIPRLNKKVVRSTGIQIATTKTLEVLEEFSLDSKRGKEGLTPIIGNPEKVLKL